ncbi:EGH [Lepeophtheirus salmonis]|uniref:EGH n=1 Tax=Lepeophtheirus salmonis TaxID=72036 RepID=A0A7R8D705_LEPSM|nr:EGH [Lepeophtheirus salmonis]CAF3022977.1 EGH [Lepeophtheirus salmonis]
MSGALGGHNVNEKPDPWVTYGTLLTCVLMLLRFVSFSTLPQTLFTLIGLVRFNAFPPNVTLKDSLLNSPFLCVRVVTRGLYPQLVKKTVEENMSIIKSVGVNDFMIEVVTDTKIGLQENTHLREIVVPSSYITKSGALNKARALQYCLEDDVNNLEDHMWIVHLDEETLLTPNSVKGILKFTRNGQHDFGQGLIIYARNPPRLKTTWDTIQNRICTVADSFRVSDDMGKLRCQLKIFNKPLFGWKGSYVVSRVGSERRVGFDNGPEGSKAEDCYFGILAMSQGYSFDFIEGEMLEKSPFTFLDFFRQRKRWMQGIYLVVTSSKISFRARIILGISLFSWLTMPLSASNIFLSAIFPMSISPLADSVLAFLGANGLYMYFYGFLKQYPIRRYSLARLLLFIPEILMLLL